MILKKISRQEELEEQKRPPIVLPFTASFGNQMNKRTASGTKKNTVSLSIK
jgi:hypothetical protein